MATKRTPRRQVWGPDDDPVAASLGIVRSSVDRARRRVARAQRDETHLVRLAADVHAARRTLKRARAHLELVAPLIGSRDAERLGRRCRAVGRLLASGRDATVLVAAFEAATTANGDDEALAQRPAVGVEELLALLQRERDEALRALRDGPALGDAGAALRDLRGDLAAVRTKRAGAKRWAKGLERLHARARRAALRALAATDADGERAHAARVRWKALGDALRGFEPAWPDQVGPLAATVEDVCERIGDQHDALVLIERLGRVPVGEASQVAAWVAQRAQSRADALLASALPVLALLAAEPSDGFAERHRGYLEAARAHPLSSARPHQAAIRRSRSEM